MSAMTEIEFEGRTTEIGRQIFALSRRAGGQEGLIDRLMMEAAMRDARIKAQLFQLVDVLPALQSPEAVNRHLREYLEQAREHLPWAAREALDFLPRDGLIGRAIAWFTLAGARRMARRFIIAEDPAGAVKAARRLRKRRVTFTVDVLGEAVLSGAEAQAYQRTYLDLIAALASEAREWEEDPQIDRDHRGALPRVNISIKLSALYSQFDPIDSEGTSQAVRERLRPVLRLARERGVFVNFDMEQYAFKDLTLRIFKEILGERDFADWADAGIAIQAYLVDSGEDLRDLARWAAARGTPVWVRLVKGAYWDYQTVIARQNNWPSPVYATKADTDANFEAQAAFLIENYGVLRPAIASHNIRSIAAALACAEGRGVPERAIEFQLLHGMAEPIKRALVSLGHRVRVYAPVGAMLPGMAYFVRRLLENTSNESFLRAGFLEHVPEEALLMNPRSIAKPVGVDTTTTQSQAPTPDEFKNEPLADFSKEAARKAMREAIASVAARKGRSYPLVIGGQRIETGAWIESVDPSHKSQIVGRCAAATPELAQQAIRSAHEAFGSWREVPAQSRAAMLRKLGQTLRQRRFDLAAWQVMECGKPWREADGDVAEAIDYCDYYALDALRLAGAGVHLPGEENATIYEPRGVAAVIAPWNFPLAILLGMTMAAVVTGNTAVMKPAEQSSVIGALLMELIEAAGFPEGVVNLLFGVGEEIGPALVRDPRVSIIAFTGSRSVGLAIQEQAARTIPGQDHLKRVITEMGGKNAIIVDDDADLDEAVHGVAASAFGYAGQKCSACSRAIVLDRICDIFLARLIEATRSLKLGPAEDPATFLGPVIDGEAHRRITDALARAKRQFTPAYAPESHALEDEGFYVAPHIFCDVDPRSWLAQEELFAPILSVIRARDLGHALEIANSTSYALTGGLYSRSPASIELARRRFFVGNLYINRKITGALVHRQPFGGYMLSGAGTKAGGPDYLRQFTWPRTITQNTMRRGFAPEDEAE